MKKLSIFLLLTAILPVLSSCNNDSDFNSNPSSSESSSSEDYSCDCSLEAVVPQTMYFREKRYDMVFDDPLEKTMAIDSLIAYWINKKDYDRFYSEDPEAEYCIDENNSIYYPSEENRFCIYSLANYSIEQYLVVGDNMGGFFGLFLCEDF